MGVVRNKCVKKLAQWTRKYQGTRFDPALRMFYNPDKRNNDAMDCIIETRDGTLFRVNTASYLEWTLFFYGTYEPFIQSLIRQFVHPGDVCIDVGANIGIHTSTMARATTYRGQVVSFEPHPQLISKLEENMGLNHFSWVTVEPYALSDKQGEAILYSFDGHDSNQGTSTLCSELISSKKTFSVKTRTLDDYLKYSPITSVNFIKIDVEGHEKSVFLGSQKTIEMHRPYIIFEHNRQQPEDTFFIIKMLSDYAYCFYAVYYQQLVPLSLSDQALDASNVLAVPLPMRRDNKGNTKVT